MAYEGMIAETVIINGHNNEAISAYQARPLGPGSRIQRRFFPCVRREACPRKSFWRCAFVVESASRLVLTTCFNRRLLNKASKDFGHQWSKLTGQGASRVAMHVAKYVRPGRFVSWLWTKNALHGWALQSSMKRLACLSNLDR